jgi:hypothetical protein
MKHPPKYRLGGKLQKPRPDGSLETDCSDYIYNLFLNAGFLVSYVPAKSMWEGKGGWGKILITREDNEPDHLDVVWWTYDGREYGHVGMGLIMDNGILGVTHASSGQGKVVLVPFRGTLITNIVGVKRLK